MILSGQTIRELGLVAPHVDKTVHNGMSYGESYAGYDIRVKLSEPFVMLERGDFCLATTVERFDMADDVIGVVHDKSTWARRAMAVQNTVIEPGWAGFLTLEISFHGNDPIVIHDGDPIAQVLFHRVDRPTDGYTGKYMNQEQRPIEARHEGI